MRHEVSCFSAACNDCGDGLDVDGPAEAEAIAASGQTALSSSLRLGADQLTCRDEVEDMKLTRAGIESLQDSYPAVNAVNTAILTAATGRKHARCGLKFGWSQQ